MAEVVFDHVTRIYPGNDKPSVDDLNLDIKDGEFLVLVGPSGCGKSTTLRMLAGLEEVNKGRILIGGKDVTTAKLTGRQKAVLWLFALSFVVMILGFIPWGSLSETMYNAFSSSTTWLTGACLGDWWFYDAATWFLLMGIIIGIVGLEDKGQLMKLIANGFSDMVSVNLVIAMARATSVIMAATGLWVL